MCNEFNIIGYTFLRKWDDLLISLNYISTNNSVLKGKLKKIMADPQTIVFLKVN